MFSFDSLFRMNNLLIISAVFLSALKYSKSETKCLPNKSTCQCVFQNGSIIDLTSLGKHDEARFQHMKATKYPDKFEYFYNPCFSFTHGPKDQECANGVAVCRVNSTRSFDCGNSELVDFVIDNTDQLHLIYHASERTTNVALICSEDAIAPKLEVLGEASPNHYNMTLTTRCACPDLCASHLSTGSVLVILFMIFVALYLILGIVHSSLTRGAHGWELIPHYEFWADFPLLVRDGCVFVFSGCKAETAYERI